MKKPKDFNTSFVSVDESPEFHDPYSELTLFLSRKVKQEMVGTPQKWSPYVHDQLLAKLEPEFRKRFPHYRLGPAALKKIWEKVTYSCQMFDNKKEALTAEGRLDMTFLIRENLRQVWEVSTLHPYLLAQQIAMKMGDYVATYEGVRPAVQQITERVWSILQHLVPPKRVGPQAAPEGVEDKWDRGIQRLILRMSGRENLLPQHELEMAVREKIRSFQALTTVSHDDLVAAIAVTLAQKLYMRAEFHDRISGNQKKALAIYLQNQLPLYREWKRSGMELMLRLKATYSQAVQKECELPDLFSQELELVIWKVMNDHFCYTSRVSTEILRLIEEEMGSVIIDQPTLPFRTVVEKTAFFLKSGKELAIIANEAEIDHKITVWTMQGDLLFRHVKLEESALFQSVVRSETIDHYLKTYPLVFHFLPLLEGERRRMEKYVWYRIETSADQSTLERFFEWHALSGVTLEQLETVCRLQLPTAPFDRAMAQQQIEACQDQRKSQ